MSTETRELIEICEQLPADKRVQVADFARFLLARDRGAAPAGAVGRWLATARAAAKPGVTTDEVMALTRGEP
jgi:hypothetical protein